MTYTPTPWIFDIECRAIWAISQKDFDDIDELSASDDVPMICDDINEANAAHIVKCVNLHDELLNALIGIIEKNDPRAWDAGSIAICKARGEAPHA